MKASKPIEERSTKELENLRKNYLAKDKIEGGPHTLVEVNKELLNRKGSDLDGKDIVNAIISLTNNSPSGITTYGELFTKIHNKKFIGNSSQSKISKDLDRVIYYCIQNELPIITTLVMRKNQEKLTEQAIQNIYDECKDLGVDVPASPDTFVKSEQEKSRNFQF